MKLDELTEQDYILNVLNDGSWSFISFNIYKTIIYDENLVETILDPIKDSSSNIKHLIRLPLDKPIDEEQDLVFACSRIISTAPTYISKTICNRKEFLFWDIDDYIEMNWDPIMFCSDCIEVLNNFSCHRYWPTRICTSLIDVPDENKYPWSNINSNKLIYFGSVR